jgi:hypothetical protein
MKSLDLLERSSAARISGARRAADPARIVARARADGDMRLWETLGGVPIGAQELVLESVLEVVGGSRGVGSRAPEEGSC